MEMKKVFWRVLMTGMFYLPERAAIEWKIGLSDFTKETRIQAIGLFFQRIHSCVDESSFIHPQSSCYWK